MSPEPRSRRRVLSVGGAALAAGLGDWLGRTAARNRPGGTDGVPDGADASRHGIDAVCYNDDDRGRTIRLRARPGDGDDPREVTVVLDPGDSRGVRDLIEEPAPGTVPHEVTADVSGGPRATETFVANAVHDLHEIHVVASAGRVRIRGVSH